VRTEALQRAPERAGESRAAAAAVTLRFEDGVAASVQVAWTPGKRRRWVAVCERGVVEMTDWPEPTVTITRPGRDTRRAGRGDLSYGEASIARVALEGARREPLREEMAGFVAAACAVRPCESAAVGVRVTEVLELAQKSSLRGAEVLAADLERGIGVVA
jgi:predicted dehydrogenase